MHEQFEAVWEAGIHNLAGCPTKCHLSPYQKKARPVCLHEGDRSPTNLQGCGETNLQTVEGQTTGASRIISLSMSPGKSQGMQLHADVKSTVNPLVAVFSSQVSCFINCVSRKIALDHVRLRLLSGAHDRWLILKPDSQSKNFNTSICTGSGSAGSWGAGSATKPRSTKSRTRCVIKTMIISVIWCSKSQTSIVTLTMEADHTALSMTLRAATPPLETAKVATAGLSHLAAHQRLVSS